MFPHSLHMILQTLTSHHKIVSIASIGVRFFLVPFYFLHTPLHGLAYYNLKFQSVLVSFILSQSLLNRFQYNLYYCLLYSCSTSRTIFSLILSFEVVPEHTLHSIVKYSIAHISIIISSSNFKKHCYTNVKPDSTFLCKTIILVMSQSSFKWSRSVHTLDAYTYIQTSTCYPHLHFLLFCIMKSVIYV